MSPRQRAFLSLFLVVASTVLLTAPRRVSRWGRAGWLSWATAACMPATAALALVLTVRSLHWPLVNDGPLYHYIAARILEGAAPYRDLFDFQFPGLYLVRMLGLTLFGPGDAGFRALDLVLLGGTLAGLALALAPVGRWAGPLAAVLFWLYHLAGGAGRAGEHDMIICLPLAWMTAAALAYARSGRPWMLGLAGVSLGAAFLIKPLVLLLAPVLAALAWRPGVGARVPAVTALMLGLMLPAIPILGWLAAADGLIAFVDVVTGYLPLYVRFRREDFVGMVLWTAKDIGVSVIAALGLWAVGGLIALWRARRADAHAAVLALGLGYGVLHFVLQGKGWEYHLYPLALFALALGAAGLAGAVEAGRRLAAVAMMAVLLFTATSLWAKGVRNLDEPWVAWHRARAQEVADALGPAVAKGGTIQVLDVTQGGVHALYLLRARQPTRFLQDFHFYHDIEHPYMRRLRAEFLKALRREPPAAVVFFERGWPGTDYRRLAGFPALAAWLDAGYQLAREGPGYRIYAARGDR